MIIYFISVLCKYNGTVVPTLHWAGLAVTLARSKQVPAHLRKWRVPAHICKATFVSRYITCAYAAPIRTKVLRLASYYVLRASLHFAFISVL